MRIVSANSRISAQLLVIAVGLLMLGATVQAVDSKATNPPDESATKALIAQLGSDDYLERREAETQLLQLGFAAFDALQAAQNDPDLEIATQSQYLLHRVPIDWVRADDSELVRQAMTNYEKMNTRERRDTITQLVALADGAGLGPLSRIAHYELSPTLAKTAALSILKERSKHQQSAEQASKSILREIAASPRESAKWLRLYAAQISNPDEVDPQWLDLIDHEISRLKTDQSSASLKILLALIEFHVELCKDANSPEPLFNTLKRRIDVFAQLANEAVDGQELRLGSDQQRDAILQAIHWCMKNEQWPALALLESHYSNAIKADRLLLYLVAAARTKEGRDSEATQMAERAFDHIDDDAEERNRTGDFVAELGHHDWAEREWKYVVEKFPLATSESMIARRSLANWCLHDRGDDKAAAEILAEVCDAVDEDEKIKSAVGGDGEASYLLKYLRVQRDYFLACHLEKQGDYDGQKKHLELAYKRDHEDPDVLIAMFRFKGSDDTYRQRVERRIARAVDGIEQSIENDPGDPNGYNHYAWLVSNTRGDFDKAVRYSLKSLELSPDTPSYLDTLGRCYFAAGELDNAVKYQRQAVGLHPQVKVMRDQLKMFEKALAEKKSSDG